MVGSKGKHVHCLFFLIRLLSCSLYFNKKTAFQSESENKVKMSHTEECIRNFDENCSECNEWKIYQQGLDERRNFLTNFWARLEGRKEHHIPHDSNVNPRLKPTSNETRTMKCAFCPELFSENAMKIHLQWFHPFHETNAMENTSMPESQMESRTELQISRESGVNPRLKQTMDEKKTWKCAVCARRFLQKDTLKKHVEMKHKKKKTLRCDMDEENTANEVKENISIDEEDISMSKQEIPMSNESALFTGENISLNEENTSVNVEDTSVNVEDTSVNVENTSVNVENTSVNEENTSVNEENTSLNEDERNDSTNENTLVIEESASMTEEDTSLNENNTSANEENNSMNQNSLSEYHVFSVHKKKLFKCETCNVSCPTKRELKKHFESVMKPIKCGLCDFNCIKIEAIRQHFESAHEVKEHSCDICDYKCDRKDVMKEHVKFYHAITFQCNLCDKRCSRKDNLKIHIKSQHHLKKPIRT